MRRAGCVALKVSRMQTSSFELSIARVAGVTSPRITPHPRPRRLAVRLVHAQAGCLYRDPRTGCPRVESVHKLEYTTCDATWHIVSFVWQRTRIIYCMHDATNWKRTVYAERRPLNKYKVRKRSLPSPRFESWTIITRVERLRFVAIVVLRDIKWVWKRGVDVILFDMCS